jgi:vacuolar-type H+-ATPase catalytic subunit A/Vma1
MSQELVGNKPPTAREKKVNHGRCKNDNAAQSKSPLSLKLPLEASFIPVQKVAHLLRQQTLQQRPQGYTYDHFVAAEFDKEILACIYQVDLKSKRHIENMLVAFRCFLSTLRLSASANKMSKGTWSQEHNKPKKEQMNGLFKFQNSQGKRLLVSVGHLNFMSAWDK